MRLAWFSPLPPVRSGIAAYSADVLAELRGDIAIDCFVDLPDRGESVYDAHDFVWRHRRAPYDLIVYQMGNAPCHDYMWAYLAAFPGLVVLHDARLHHARARALLSRGRAADYRAEFQFDHPDADRHFAEYAIEGLGGPIYSFWSMLRVAMVTARSVAVHNPRVASDLRDEYPSVIVDTLRMGVRPSSTNPEAARRIRRQLSIPDEAVVFAAFGRMTAEKRLGPLLRAFQELLADGGNAYLVFIGEAIDAVLARETAGLDRVRATGHVGDADIGAYLEASDICLCLRWPTALETSASWLRCLAAHRATVITDLAHLADIPAMTPQSRIGGDAARPPVTMAIDLLDEHCSLRMAMQRLATDRALRDELARNGHTYWRQQHTLEMMATDYREILRAAMARPAPVPKGLPAHITEDYAGAARRIARQFDAVVDILRDTTD